VIDMKMKDAVVLVTGANRGLGRALVERSVAAGAKKVYAGARNPAQLEPLVAAAPKVVVPLRIDVTDGVSLSEAAARAPDVTVLFNNAGVLASYSVLSSTRAQIEEDLGTNFFGLLAATKAVLPTLERAHGGAIVNVLSVVSHASMPALGGYAAAKAAALSVTQALRVELAKKDIAVHAVFPGPIDTDMVRTFEMPKTSPVDVANAILAALEQGIEDIYPDPMSRDFHGIWKTDPKALERRFASM
jgi:NAD(P)-dependent dehydrogenase (short-subunit alcohol dehydrogenase family)